LPDTSFEFFFRWIIEDNHFAFSFQV